MTRTMCRNKSHRKFRLRLNRVFLVMAIIGIIMLIISVSWNVLSTHQNERQKAQIIVAEPLSSSTEKENVLNSATNCVIECNKEKKHFDNILELYMSDEVSKSEKVALFEFYTSEMSKEFESYYSARLGRYVTAFEMYSLMRITYSEAGTQGVAGKTAVAATVLNRMEDGTGLFGNRIYDVIFQKYQFSSADILDEQRETSGRYFSGGIEQKYDQLDSGIKASCIKAVKCALDGEDPTRAVTGGALFFYNPDQCSDEELALRASIPYDNICIIEEHWFHREWPTA